MVHILLLTNINCKYYYNLEDRKEMDVFDRIMKFMKHNHLKPSKALIQEYQQSKTTFELNEFPSADYLKEKIDMNKEDYDKLQKRYNKIG